MSVLIRPFGIPNAAAALIYRPARSFAYKKTLKMQAKNDIYLRKSCASVRFERNDFRWIEDSRRLNHRQQDRPSFLGGSP
jgi:hypothetical protein